MAKATFEFNNTVKCFCGECDGTPYEPERKYFVCKCCGREVPYCYGASDEYYDFCDLCAYVMRAAKEETEIAFNK